MKHLAFVGALLLSVKITLVQGTDCTPSGRSHVKCTLEVNSSVACDESGPAYRYKDDSWPHKPINAKLIPGTFLYKGIKYGTAGATWQAPQDQSIKYLNGFLLTFTSITLNGYRICRLFNLTQTNWTSNDYLNTDPIVFDFSLGSVLRDGVYFVELTSLPRSPSRLKPVNYVSWTFEMKGYGEKNSDIANTAYWYSFMVYDINEAERLVTVTFTLAPPEYNFKKYDVYLAIAGSDRFLQKKNDVVVDLNAKHHAVTFENVPIGTYRIELQPQKYGDNRICLCKVASSPNCVPCMRTITREFNVTGVQTTTEEPSTAPATVLGPQTGKSSEQPNNMTVGAIVGIITGVAGAVSLLLVMGFLFYRRRLGSCSFGKKGKDGIAIVGPSPRPKRPLSPKGEGEKEIIVKRRVLLIYNHDHAQHVDVVFKFANFLYKLCGCHVIFDRWEQKMIQTKTVTEWLLDEMSKADKIIVINSEGGFKRWRASQENADYEKKLHDHLYDDHFLLAMRLLHNRLSQGSDYRRYVSTRFEYTAKEYEIPTLAETISSNVTLMKHIESLFFHIHDMNKDEPGYQQEALGINENYMCHSREGAELDKAIKTAVNYEKRNPGWFEDTHTMDRKDSGLGSFDPSYVNVGVKPQVVIPPSNGVFPLQTDLPEGIYIPTPSPEEGRSWPDNFIPPDYDVDVVSAQSPSEYIRETNRPYFDVVPESADCETLFTGGIQCGNDHSVHVDEESESVVSLAV